MKPNQAYFHRNRGSWNWRVRFELVSWAVLWKAEISFFSKICISFIWIVQQSLGTLQMWTNVFVQESENIVHHSTKIKIHGLTLYRCEKHFFLDDDGIGIRLEGKEYFWPLIFVGIQFSPTFGTVDVSTTRASYQMPMAGTLCACQAFLELPEGHIDIEAPWIKGRFSLTDASNKILQQ